MNPDFQLNAEALLTFRSGAEQAFGAKVALVRDSSEPDHFHLWPFKKQRVDFLFTYSDDAYLLLNKND